MESEGHQATQGRIFSILRMLLTTPQVFSLTGLHMWVYSCFT